MERLDFARHALIVVDRRQCSGWRGKRGRFLWICGLASHFSYVCSVVVYRKTECVSRVKTEQKLIGSNQVSVGVTCSAVASIYCSQLRVQLAKQSRVQLAKQSRMNSHRFYKSTLLCSNITASNVPYCILCSRIACSGMGTYCTTVSSSYCTPLMHTNSTRSHTKQRLSSYPHYSI